ncbi:hypothetical protein FOXYS1_1835 [Fusarium oxysporum]|uniref:NAD-dependent epimerase/dehydratase domain-containing protein n=1 Tax=Fusarium oxysporum TaxID=5507 RepID=A0A8H5EP75_FUSOX|nr:hypothetical protein FOXYS1_1835 [Fusarium oxysporum]
MTKIFLTGATGYIGGDVLHTLLKSHPEYKVRALVRDVSKGAAITKSYSQVQLVTGGLDDADIIAQEAQDADVVLHLAATGHLKSVQNIYEALSKKPKGAKPPYYIQISGASALAAGELADKSRVFGTGSDVIYNDLTGVDSIKSLIKQYPSRAVDNYIFSVSEQNSHVKTALVVPPIIYGQGRGPGNQRSIQIPGLAKATLVRKKGLQVGSGDSRWGNIHIADLSRIFLSLVEKAVEGNKDEDIWGANGLFFTGAGELSFAEISRRIAVAANDFNLIPTTEVDSLDGKEIDSIIPHGSVLLGTNARAGADRARKVLGWEPEYESLEEHIPTTVIQEAEALGVEGSRKRRILRGPKGGVMIPEDLPKECFWAKLKCAHGSNPLHFLSEFDPLISLDGTPDYEITFRSRRWWEDHDPWLDAYKEALKTSDEGWKMRDETMKQDDSVSDDEGADDWDFMCLPIPADEDGKFCGEFEDDDEEEGDGETANNTGKENDEKPF